MRDRAGAVEPNDVTLRIDTARPGECGPRDIDVSERTLVKQEGMKYPCDAVEANDVAPRVDPEEPVEEEAPGTSIVVSLPCLSSKNP